MNTLPTFELGARYELLRQVGRGLLGVVFEGIDRRTGKAVAAKLLTHAQSTDPDEFRREYEALSRLDHPHLASYHERVEHEETTYLVGQYVDGLDLMSYLRQPPTTDELEALREREELADRQMAEADAEPTSGALDEDELAETLEAIDEEERGVEGDDTGEAAEPDGDTDRSEGATSEATSDEEATEGVGGPAPAEPAGESLEAEPTAAVEEVVAEVADLEADADSTRQSLPVDLDLVLLRLEQVLPQIVDALEHLHRFGKQHGDLKPTNILVDPRGRCLLTDYGVLPHLTLEHGDDAANAASRSTEDDTAAPHEESATPHASEGDGRADQKRRVLPTVAAPGERFGAPPTGAMQYTYRYRAPETLGVDEATAESDLYALGCLLFEAIAGRPPFEGTIEEMREQHLEEQPRSLSEIEPTCPASWADVIHGLLDKHPKRRPGLAEVGQLVEYSESYAVDIPPSAVPEQDFFFGRSELIDEIVAEIKESYQQKRLGVSVLRGPAGVGKTAITKAVSYLASRRGWLVLNGKCYNRESLIYQGWDDIAAQLADIYRELPPDLKEKTAPARRQAATLFPVLRLDTDPPVKDRGRLVAIDGLRRLLRRLSTQRPLLLLFDDLHWASWDTSALLLDLIGEPNGLRCMVLGTWLEHADHRRHPLVRGLMTAPGPVEWFNVAGFSKDEAREYVISAGSHLSLQEQRQVLKTGELNPLLLEELIQDLRPGEATADEVEDLIEAPAEEQAAVAEKLTDVLETRIEALNRRERFVLEVLSVASIPLSRAVISTIVDEEFHSTQSVENTAQDALDALLEARFIQPVDSRQWKIAYTVTQNLYRLHILEELREQHYAHLCERIAEGIRRCWPTAEELRFEYLLRANQTRQAADSALRAAHRAEERHAYNRAAKLWRWLTEHAGHTSLSPDIVPRAEHARMEYLAQQYTAAARLYHQVVRDTESRVEQARLSRREFRANLHAGKHPRSREALAKALETLGVDYRQDGLLSRIGQVKDRALAATSRWSDHTEEARVDALDDEQRVLADLYKEALDAGHLLEWPAVRRFRNRLAILGEKTKDARLLGLDRLQLAKEAIDHGGRKRLQRIDNWLSEALTLFERSADWELRGRTELCRAAHLRHLGRFDEALECLMTATKYLRHAGQTPLGQRHLLERERAWIFFDCGDLRSANMVAQRLIHLARHDRFAAFFAYQVRVECALMTGHTEELERLKERCREFLIDTPTGLAQLWLIQTEARYNIALGRPEVAVGQLDVFAEQMHKKQLFSKTSAEVTLHLRLGQALAALAEREQILVEHRPTETLRRLKSSLRTLQSNLNEVSIATHAQIRRLEARHHFLNNRPQKALRSLDAAVERLVDYDNPLEHGRCLEARGFVLLALEDPDARALIDQAHRLYRHYGAHLPLFLEGWPVPPGHSRLQRDEE